jgi:hypothetical protein
LGWERRQWNWEGEREGRNRRTANTTTAEVRRDDERRELFGCDLALADCTFEAGVGVFEDVEVVIHVIVIATFDGRASESAG